MLDEEVVACVAAAAGHCGERALVEQLGGKQGLLVCRVRLPGAGSFIFKAVRPSGRRELALSARLSQVAPDLVPRVLTWEEDARRGLYWLVAHDEGTQRLADAPTWEGYVEAARALARVQLATLEHVDELAALGVPTMGVAEWEELALRTLDLAQHHGGPLLAGCLADLEGAVWATSDIARDTLGLPRAVVHGDLHAGNIGLGTGGGICLLDWGTAYLGAAPLGLEELLLPAARHLRDVNSLNAVRAAYCREWTPVMGRPGRLERAFLACQALVRLAVLDENLRGQATWGAGDPYATAAAARQLAAAWRAWAKSKP